MTQGTKSIMSIEEIERWLRAMLQRMKKDEERRKKELAKSGAPLPNLRKSWFIDHEVRIRQLEKKFFVAK